MYHHTVIFRVEVLTFISNHTVEVNDLIFVPANIALKVNPSIKLSGSIL